MNAVWGGICGANKIMIDLSSHKTTDNIMRNKEFTVSVADAAHVVEEDYVGVISANNVPDKLEKV